VTAWAPRAGAVLLALVASAHAAAIGARLRPGSWQARLCVATAPAPPSCGPALARIGQDGQLRVRVDDIVYRLTLRSTQVDIVLMHGAMQLDEFTTTYEWSGRTLRFRDDEHAARYEVRFPEAGPAPR